MRIDHLEKASEEAQGYLDSLADRSPRCAVNPDGNRLTVQGARKRYAEVLRLFGLAADILDGMDKPMPRPKAKSLKSKK